MAQQLAQEQQQQQDEVEEEEEQEGERAAVAEGEQGRAESHAVASPSGGHAFQQQQQQQDQGQQHHNQHKQQQPVESGALTTTTTPSPSSARPDRISSREWRRQCNARRRAAREALPPSPSQLADRNMPGDPPAGLSREQLWDAAVDVIVGLGDPEAAGRVREERHNWYRLMRVCQILLGNEGRKLSEMDIDTRQEPDYDFRWAQGAGGMGRVGTG